ncbi:hypothetical protein KP79_PYT20825 [Mizuhopecten yessoensis]|uniref:THD domain-containing protein n=1 Tax=Mizuhopecten yessoensis TaxID=6573 RepID=A0A210R1F9_MIZYE|nr:hypothetical protein KP79_PYT20825 [Mizuhopecten yessoensis]
METDETRHTQTVIAYKRMKNILKTSFVANIVLTLIVMCVFIARRSGLLWTDVILPSNTTSTDAQVNNRVSLGSRAICITCGLSVKDLRTTLYDYITTTASSTNLCCLENDPDKQDIILELAATGHTQYIYEGPSTRKLTWWTERNYAAHLYADHLPNNNKLIWTTTRHSTSFVRNLTLSTDDWKKLTVPDVAGAGKYLVYSMFTFDFRDEATINYSQTIRHVIMKNNNSLQSENGEKIFQSTLGSEYMSVRQTTYLSGVVSLNKSDTVYVKAFSMSLREYTTEKYIDASSPYNNFFGMFKLE